MKSVLISIQPKWCELIANGKKTIEVRKTKPKLKPPFLCYIYCTKPREKIFYHGEYYKDLLYKDFWSGELVCGCTMDDALNGEIIGEFVCDRIDTIDIIDDSIMTYIRVNQLSQLSQYSDVRITAETCLNIDQLQHYLDEKEGYGWHISDLKIYDKPKKLGEFGLTRPPQSWCYVEEVKSL